MVLVILAILAAILVPALFGTNGLNATTFKVSCEADWPTTGTPVKKDNHKVFTINYVEYQDATGHVYFYNNEWTETGPSTAPTTKIYKIICSD